MSEQFIDALIRAGIMFALGTLMGWLTIRLSKLQDQRERQLYIALLVFVAAATVFIIMVL